MLMKIMKTCVAAAVRHSRRGWPPGKKMSGLVESALAMFGSFTAMRLRGCAGRPHQRGKHLVPS